MRRIGILLYAKQDQANVSPMLRELEALGYVDGKTIAVEYRDAEGKFERLPLAADELVRLNLRRLWGLLASIAISSK
jgi:putative tryptophan/tyrosine transport system substrate-binding protein